MIYNHIITQDSPYDPRKLAIYSILHPEVDPISNWNHNFKKTISLVDMVQFIDSEDIVTLVDFDFGITFHAGAPNEVGRINQGRRNISGSSGKPKSIRSNDQNNCSTD